MLALGLVLLLAGVGSVWSGTAGVKVLDLGRSVFDPNFSTETGGGSSTGSVSPSRRPSGGGSGVIL